MPTINGLHELVSIGDTYMMPWRGFRVEDNMVKFFSRLGRGGERAGELILFGWNGATVNELASYDYGAYDITHLAAAPTSDGWWIGVSGVSGGPYFQRYANGDFGTPIAISVIRPSFGGMGCSGDVVHTMYTNNYSYYVRKNADNSFAQTYIGGSGALSFITDTWIMGQTPITLWTDGAATAKRVNPDSSVTQEFGTGYRWKGNGALHPSGEPLSFTYRGTSDYNFHYYAYLRERNASGNWSTETSIFNAQSLGHHHVNFASPAYDSEGTLHVLIGVTNNTTGTESEAIYIRRRRNGTWEDPELLWQASDDTTICDLPWCFYPYPEEGVAWGVPIHHGNSGQHGVGIFAVGLKLGYSVPWWSSMLVGGG